VIIDVLADQVGSTGNDDGFFAHSDD
jgi:hypothetical protein